MADRGADDKIRLAREALAAARAEAAAKGLRPVRPPASVKQGEAEVPGPAPNESAAHPALPQPVRRATSGPTAGRHLGGSPGLAGGPPHADPVPLALAIGRLLDAEGWTLAAATGSVFGRWAQIVGADLAAHTTPESLTDGELTVTADSTAWATQLRLLAAQLVRRLNSELGDGTVQRVKVRGPVTAQRKPGEWRVRGGPGLRDTYG